MKNLVFACMTVCPFLSFSQRNETLPQQPPVITEKPAGYHEHDGFYLSMSAGPAFGSITTDQRFPGKFTYSGGGSSFDLKIGGAIIENLILHGTILSTIISGPNVTLNGQKMKTSTDESIGETMIGGGVTYYLMPLNFFVSASSGMGNFTYTDNSGGVNTDRGFSMQLKAGKEWWISKNWAFGIGATYAKTSLTDSGIKFDSNRFSILFNTTFN